VRATARAAASREIAVLLVGELVMKLPAEGSRRVNSATMNASSDAATPALRIVRGAPTPAVTAMTPNAK
jgi:hypothetical protein